MKMKIVIANRGEITLRINATCQTLGNKTVALYTEEDQCSSYVFQADASFQLPQNGLAGYLDQDAIIKIAQQADAHAIHPGYGFLAENAEFAQKVIDAGLLWIGPTPESIAALASKAHAQKIMLAAGIPTIPGYSFNTQIAKNFDAAKKTADMIGYPVILKCAHGGGGKAMRSVQTEQNFANAWRAVASESKKIFRSHTVLVEKQLNNARHVEVQIAGDGQNYIHLYERECSIQRNHQKVIETAPCSFLDAQTKQNLLKTALAAAKAVNYESIGTVEFLVTPEQNFYFLEMNTRLQVEHSVTELTTNIDLIHLQLHLAIHKKLPYQQHEIRQSGYAIECRIYAENPEQNFAPSTGTITNLTFPNHPFLRIDHDLNTGQEITPFFDPMLAKLTTWADTKELAIARMKYALERANISGPKTNIDFLKKILLSQEFTNDQIHTKLLHDKNYLKTLALPPKKPILTNQDYNAVLNLAPSPQKPSVKTSLWKSQRWSNHP